MENEELAALRASLLAAERQPAAVKDRQARLSAVLADGGDLVPYVLAASCCDPRDRLVHGDLRSLRILESGTPGPEIASPRARGAYEPAPLPPTRLAAVLACIAILWLLGHALTFVLLAR